MLKEPGLELVLEVRNLVGWAGFSALGLPRPNSRCCVGWALMGRLWGKACSFSLLAEFSPTQL